MLVDALNEFANSASVIAGTGTANVGNQIDLQAANLNIGVGAPLWLAINVTSDIIAGGGAGTIAFQLASDDSAAIATNGTQTIHFTSGTFVTNVGASNELDAGSKFFFALPASGFNALRAELRPYERFLGVQVVIASQAVTAGAIDAFITNDANIWKDYADAVN